MNYGKFFRLNQSLSKIEDGVAIFDYIDLPAYFEASVENKMSPKYPINVTITEDCIRFRVHYSNYYVNDSSSYIYDVKKAMKGAHINDDDAIIPLNHMDEVIMEFPYMNDSTDRLYKRLREVYDTSYPAIIKGEKNIINNFIYDLIIKRYQKLTKEPEDFSLQESLYHNLRVYNDGDLSYSTLWLMGLSANGEYSLSSNAKKDDLPKVEEESNCITGFLRKLVLDFMFDLNHSDVFQTSKYYQAMYTGLMSNFYFSALIHKCEYYYYRGLITDVIDKKRIKDPTKRTDHVRCLYAQKLFGAEKAWIQDIMSPASEKYFEHYYTNNSSDKGSLLSELSSFIKRLWNPYRFKVWNSWFAKPEEEMRRVCFTMKDDCEENHLCNSETIVEYLNLFAYKSDEASNKMIKDSENFRVAISQWYLKRYAFVDVLHMHMFKSANWFFFIAMLLIISLLFVFPESVTKQFWLDRINIAKFVGGVTVVVLLYKGMRAYWPRIKKERNDFTLGETRKILVFKRTIAIVLITTLLFFVLIYAPNFVNDYFPCWSDAMNEESSNGTLSKLAFVLAQIGAIVFINKYINKICNLHWLSNMHLFYPRLIASITTAWLTLAIGNELFGTFFDSIVSWSTSIWLAVIVFVFAMYEINNMLPFENIWNRLYRCLGIIVISYVISLIVGLFIINFTGERFLERSGVLEDFYSQYVNGDEKQVENKHYSFYSSTSDASISQDSSTMQVSITNILEERDSLRKLTKLHGTISMNNNEKNGLSDAERLKGLEKVYIVKKGTTDRKHPVVTTWKVGNSKFFILRDFLIQFAFVAMFIGLFIQMLFEEKSITEV